MYYIVQENKLAGISTSNSVELTGYSIVEGPDAPLEKLYYDGTSILARPPKPELNNPWQDYFWDDDINSWVEQEDLVANYNSMPDWVRLVDSLRGTPVFAKLYDASEKTIRAQAAFSMLMTTLTVTKNMDDLAFSMERMRAALQASTVLEDLNQLELDFINSKLEEANFTYRVE